MYERTDDLGKRIANQAFYQRILITEDEKAAIQLNEPFAALAPTSTDVRCSNTSNLVELRVSEVMTYLTGCAWGRRCDP